MSLQISVAVSMSLYVAPNDEMNREGCERK